MEQQHNTQDTINVVALIKRCLKNWYWFLICGFICCCLAVVYVLVTNKQWGVSTSFMMKDKSPMGGMAQMMAGNSEMLSILGVGGASNVADELYVINSRTVMQQAVRNYDLQTEYRKKERLRWIGQYPERDLTVHLPELFKDTMQGVLEMKLHRTDKAFRLKVKYGKEKSKHAVFSLTEPVMTCIGPVWFDFYTELQPGDKYLITTTSINRLVTDLRKEYTASQVKKGSNIVTISVSTDMPERAEDIMRSMINSYDMEATIDKNKTAAITKQFLDERLMMIAQELDSVETEVEQYKKDNNLTSLSDEAKLYVMTSNEYRMKIVEVETQINLVDYIRDFVQNKDNQNSPIPSNLGIQDPSLVALIGEYNTELLKRQKIQRTATAENPMLAQLDEQLALIRSNIVTSIASVRDGLVIMKKDLQQQDRKFSGQIDNVPTQEKEYVGLVRQQTITQQIYLFLYQKREEAAITMASNLQPTRVIDPAQTTPEPVAPRKLIVLLIAVILGMGIPFGVFFLQEWYGLTAATKKEDEEKPLNA